MIYSKLIVICFLFLILSSCAKDRENIKPLIMSKDGKKYQIECIDNVEYIYVVRHVVDGYRNAHAFMSPHLKTNGKPYLCETGLDN